MNQNRHRVVFNAARGLRMVVAESARSIGKATAMATITAVTTGLMGLLVLTAAQAQIVADPKAPGNQRPTILTAPNGVPLVNIQTPSAGGVSRNTYSQFDVNGQGAILNNSRTATPTQLGGHVAGNPWLATGPARVILNEVNSNNPSHLKGPVEVAGQRAEVIIANPAGIQVNGGSFINASGVTLTTGTPVFNKGSLEGYAVRGGKVHVEGLGLDNGALSSKGNFMLMPNGEVINAGTFFASLKNTVKTPDKVVNTGVIGAGESLSIQAAEIHNTQGGEILSLGQMDLNATQRIENRSARIEAKGDLSVTTPTLVNANEHFKTELVAQPGQRYLRLRHNGVDYKAEDLGMNFDRLDQYDDQAHYAVLLPSSEYPFGQYPALVDQWAVSADGRYQVQLSRVEESMSTYEDEVRSTLKAQFDAGELLDMGEATDAFNALSKAFPISGSKIDWQHVPGSIASAERDATLQQRRFVEFFDEMRVRFQLTGPVTYAGDSATDFAMSGEVDAIRKALPTLLEVPQHHYFIGPYCLWCMCMTMEGDMGFGHCCCSQDANRPSKTRTTP